MRKRMAKRCIFPVPEYGVNSNRERADGGRIVSRACQGGGHHL